MWEPFGSHFRGIDTDASALRTLEIFANFDRQITLGNLAVKKVHQDFQIRASRLGSHGVGFVL
jgi:hypothetical protein